MEELMRILKKSKAIAFILVLLLAFFPFSDFSCAQSSSQHQARLWVDVVIIKTDGEIIGVVQDEESPLSGAEVALRKSQGQFVNTTFTDTMGSFTLTSETGTIKIYTENTQRPISDAVVYLDSHYMGVTDQTGWLTISDVSPGDHTITVAKEGFADYQSIIVVYPGETLYIKLEMRKPTNWLNILVIVITVGGGILIAGGAILKYIREKEEYPYS